MSEIFFSFVDNDIFFEMNTNLIDYINLERISFVYKGTKYFITPEKNNYSEYFIKQVKLAL